MGMQRIRFFWHTRISFDIHTDLLLKVRDRLKTQQDLLVFDLLLCKNVMRMRMNM